MLIYECIPTAPLRSRSTGIHSAPSGSSVAFANASNSFAFENWVRGAARIGQSPVLRGRFLQLDASVHPLSGLSAVVNELVTSFLPWNRQHLLGSVSSFQNSVLSSVPQPTARTL